MIRFVGGLFFGAAEARSGGCRAKRRLPLLMPQFVLIAGIFVLSLFPKLLMDPVSAAIDPQFASTLVWDGMSLETIYGYWNPAPVMIAAVAVAVTLGLLARLVRPVPRPDVVNPHRFVILDRLVPGLSMPPVAVFFWQSIASGALAAADLVRRLYSGNGQTYALYVLSYVLVIYVAGTGLAGLWVGD